LTTKDKHYYDSQFQQATLVTWTFKVVIIIFVCVSALDTIGIKTDDMLEITTVFSLGLSWSMRIPFFLKMALARAPGLLAEESGRCGRYGG
jgi:hypothetical protein